MMDNSSAHVCRPCSEFMQKVECYFLNRVILFLILNNILPICYLQITMMILIFVINSLTNTTSLSEAPPSNSSTCLVKMTPKNVLMILSRAASVVTVTCCLPSGIHGKTNYLCDYSRLLGKILATFHIRESPLKPCKREGNISLYLLCSVSGRAADSVRMPADG